MLFYLLTLLILIKEFLLKPRMKNIFKKRKKETLTATYHRNAATGMAVLLQQYLQQAENRLSIDDDDKC